MIFEYNRLTGRIIEMYGSKIEFAKAMNWSTRTLSVKLNNKTPWKQQDIVKAVALLKIPIQEVHSYFFTAKVQRC